MVETCPQPADLARYLQGLTDDGTESAAIELHLLQCAACTRHASTLGDSDELSQFVRRCLQTPAVELPACVFDVVRRCRELPIWVADVPTATARSQATLDVALSRQLQQRLQSPLYPGDLGAIAKYRVLGIVGAGANGLVLDGIDAELSRPVAIKLMHPERLAESSTARERFRREAQLASAVHDERIVQVYEVGELDGVPYLAMERLVGETLEERLARDPILPPGIAMQITAQILLGLRAAHRRGLIHRDIKPANIWLLSDRDACAADSAPATDAAPQIKILDFGLARPLNDNLQLTQDGTILGTPGFWSPEQAAGKPVDARSDLFSVGCVLYRMLTGSLPFQGDDLLAYLLALAKGTYVAPSLQNPQVPPTFDPVLQRLLAGKVEDRTDSAEEAYQDLTRLREDNVGSMPTPHAGTLGPNARGRSAIPRWVLLMLLPCVVWLGVTRVRTETGTIIVKGIDEAVEVEVLQHHSSLQLIVVDKQGNSTLKLTPGPYEVRARYRDGVEFSTTQPIEVLRGETVAVRVEYLLETDARRDTAKRSIAESLSAPSAAVELKQRMILGGTSLRHYESISCVAAGSAEHTCVTGGIDGRLRYWHITNDQLLAEADAHSPTVTSIVVHPGDGRVVSTGGDGLVKIWRLIDGGDSRLHLEHTLILPGPVSAVRLNASGSLLAAMSGKGIELYDMAGYQQVRSILLAGVDLQQPNGMAFLNGSDQLIVRGDHRVMLYDGRTGQELRSIALHDKMPLSVAVDPTDQYVAVGMMAPESCVQVLKLASGAKWTRFAITEDGDEPIDIEFAPHGQQLLVVSGRRASQPESDPLNTNRISLWPLAGDGDPIVIKPPVYNSGFLDAVYLHAGVEILAASRDVWGTIWRADTGKRVALRDPAPYSAMAVTRDGRIIGGAIDGQIHLMDATGSGTVQTLAGHESYVFDLDVSDDDRLLVSTSTDGTVRTWDLATGENRWTSRQWSTGVKWFSGPDAVLVGGRWYAQTPHLLSAATGAASNLGRLLADTPVNCFAVLEPELVCTGSVDGPVQLWNLLQQRLVGTIPVAPTAFDVGANSLAISPDGSVLAVGYDETIERPSRLSLWDLASRRLLASQELPSGRIMSIDFPPDGRLLATGSWNDARVRIWDARSLQVMGEAILGPTGGGVGKVAFVKGGAQLAALGSDGRVVLLDVRQARP